MIHAVSQRLKRTYPLDRFHKIPRDPEGIADDPDNQIAYVLESEIAVFYRLDPLRLRGIIGAAFIPVYADDELFNQFFLYKTRGDEDIPLRFLACERMLQSGMLPKRVCKSWEWMLAEMYAIDGSIYATKDATEEEDRAYQQQIEKRMQRGLTKEEKDYLRDLDQDLAHFFSRENTDLKVLLDICQNKTVPTSLTRLEEPLLLPERIRA